MYLQIKILVWIEETANVSQVLCTLKTLNYTFAILARFKLKNNSTCTEVIIIKNRYYTKELLKYDYLNF